MANVNDSQIISHEDAVAVVSGLTAIASSLTRESKSILIPTLASESVSYTGNPIDILAMLDNVDRANIVFGGDIIETEEGEYTLTMSLKTTGDQWTDSTTAAKSISWKIETFVMPSWSTGTDAQIVEAVSRSDAGTLDLTEYWSVGDERTISLAAMSATGVGESHVAQDVTYVIVALDTKTTSGTTNPCYNYQYSTATSGRSYASVIVQQKNGLGSSSTTERGYMNSTYTNSGSWGSCARKTWCDAVYKPSIPSSIRDIFKQVKVKTIATYNGSSMQESDCYFFLPAAAEVFKGDSSYGQGGTAGAQTAYSNLTEFNALSQWPYYATAANRIKNDGDSGSAYYWWERSPFCNDSRFFCGVYSDGSAYYGAASGAYLVAPAGCI